MKQLCLWFNTLANCWRRLRAWCARTRPSRALPVLLLALIVSVGEPLLCILHCQIWLPLTFGHYLALQHQHHQHMAGMDMPGLAVGAQAGSSAVRAASPSLACQMRGETGAGVPFHVPPSPLHDLLFTASILLPLALLARRGAARPPRAPPPLFFPPPLPPPRPFAA